MGLDMYFNMKRYETVSRYRLKEGAKVPENFYPAELKGLQEHIFERNFLGKDCSYGVGYFRKFNALHNWIVKNCANGVDECQEIILKRSDIEKILFICKEIQSDHSKAPKLMPTGAGFFFGSTEYDDWYFEDIDCAIDLMTEILKVLDEEAKYREKIRASGEVPAVSSYSWEVIYQASW